MTKLVRDLTDNGPDCDGLTDNGTACEGLIDNDPGCEGLINVHQQSINSLRWLVINRFKLVME